MKKILIALAGGSIPGGLFMAGVIEEIIKYFFVKKASGASSGAINAVALMSKHGDNLSQMWLESLSGLNGLVTFKPKEVIRNNSFFKIQDFTENIFEKITKKDYLKKCHDTLVVYTKLNKKFSYSNDITFTDRVLFPLLIVPSIRKSIGMTTETIDLEKVSEEERLIILKASCCLPFFYGLPVKINGQIAFDGQMNEDLGGLPKLLESYTHGDCVGLAFRYEKGSPKYIYRAQKFNKLCDKHDVPLNCRIIFAPEEKLPLTGHYAVNQKSYPLCIEAGKNVVKKCINKIS